MSSTVTIQQTLDFVRTYPSLTSVLGNPVAGYGGNAVPIRIANKVLQEVLQKPFAFKWNRVKPTAFYTNQLQQDYSTSITDLGWIENCTREYINYSPDPKPIRGVEAVRELLPASVQGTPEQICWIPNSEAICGTWTANQLYQTPVGAQAMPVQPLTQIRDSNGNIQVVTGYGTTGAAAPVWPAAGATPGTVTNDGSVQWTLIDPNGITFRLSPKPAQNDIVWLIQPYYQKKPGNITAMTQVWGIPDEMTYIFEQGFLAYAWDCAEDYKKFEIEYAKFQNDTQKACAASDREAESFVMYPGRNIKGQYGTWLKGEYQYPPGLFSGF